jgi:hypothetical protein
MKLRHYLKKYPNTIVLRILRIETDIVGVHEDNVTPRKVHRLILSEPIPEVRGSVPMPDGSLNVMHNVTEVHLVDDNVKHVKDFRLNNYGGMKLRLVELHLDISRPQGRMMGDEFVITKPAKVWITHIPFARIGQISRQSLNSLVNKITKR